MFFSDIIIHREVTHTRLAYIMWNTKYHQRNFCSWSVFYLIVVCFIPEGGHQPK